MADEKKDPVLEHISALRSLIEEVTAYAGAKILLLGSKPGFIMCTQEQVDVHACAANAAQNAYEIALRNMLTAHPGVSPVAVQSSVPPPALVRPKCRPLKQLRNAVEYRVTKAQAEAFRRSLDAPASEVGDVARIKRDAFSSQLGDLQEQLTDFEHRHPNGWGDAT